MLRAEHQQVETLVGRSVANVLQAAQRICLRAGMCEMLEAPILGSLSAVISYYHVLLARSLREEVHIAYLDTRKRLLRSECLSTGSLAEVSCHPREICPRTLELGAGSVILIHNHPSGHSSPSRQDVAINRQMIGAGAFLGIEVVDHIIVAIEDFCSLRAEGPPGLFKVAGL